MRALIVISLAWIYIGAASAENVTLYKKETDKFWSVYGEANPETGQATCYGEANKKDGSFIQIHRSLVDGELWAIIRNMAWEIDSENGGELRWNFYREGANALIDGTEFEYAVRNKNTVLVLQIKSKRFTEVLWNARYHTLFMPGNLQNVSFSFERSGASMLNALADCVAKNEKKYKDYKPKLERIPNEVKDKI